VSTKMAMPISRPEDGGSKDLWNVDKLLPDYTALQPRRQSSLYALPWEPQISHLTSHSPCLCQHKPFWIPFVHQLCSSTYREAVDSQLKLS
jgi:hypothetical protein